MAGGLLCCSVLLALLVMINISCGYCAPWWSILPKVGYINANAVLWTKDRCRTRLNGILNERQRNKLCDECPLLVSAIINGVHSATMECQRAFRNSKWMCRAFRGGPYFGQFIEEGTRETAFVSAIVSAAIVEKVAQAKEASWCDDEEEEGSTFDITHTCDDDIDYAIKFIEKFTGPSGDTILVGSGSGDTILAGSGSGDTILAGSGSGDTFSGVNPDEITTGDGEYSIEISSDEADIQLMEAQNNKVGRELMKKYWLECCKGNCAIRPIDHVREQLLEAYSNAEDLTTSLSFVNTQLVYLKQSPNFCQRNITYGIEGTSDRRCYPDETGSSICDYLCCGGETYICGCSFVWCCHIECRMCCR